MWGKRKSTLSAAMLVGDRSDRESDLMVESSSSRASPVWVAVLAALLGGIVAGTVAKLADESSIPAVGHIGTTFGVWIVLVAVIAAWSHSLRRAVLCAVTFLLAMVGSYYVVQMLLFGFFSTYLFLAWAAIGLFLAPSFAALVWHARGSGWLSAVSAAVPVGLLLYEAYSVRWKLQNPFNDTYKVQFVFDIVAAIVLLLILTRDRAQRMRVLALTPVIVLGAPVVLEYVWAVVGRLMWIG